MVSTKTALSRILFIVYLFAVGFLCFASFGAADSIAKEICGVPTDKIAHFLMFLPFPILAYLSFDHNKKGWRSVLFVIVSFAAGCGIAAGTEFIQGLLPYRFKDIHDFYADMTALGISSVIVLFSDLRRKK